MQEDMPVYVFTGFLEAGKTSFIQSTLEDKRFNSGERTLILLCEEGEEEFDFSKPGMDTVFVETIENEADLTPDRLKALEAKHNAERVIVEYNGMWMLASLYNNFPEHWMLYQELMFADATTFMAYNLNMRNLMVDKLAGAELVVFNRFDKSMDKMEFHKIVQAISRRTDIAYEYPNGFTEYDDIEDPLPFDIDAPIVEIKMEDYALWYRDVSEDPKKYDGKTIRVSAMAARNKRLPEGSFVMGRPVMTCCEADIQFMGFVYQYPKEKELEMPAWYEMQGVMRYKFNRMYGKKGPVIEVESMTPVEKPENEVATFY